MTRILGIIPARGGSTRIEQKNITPVGGKPLIAHTIEQCSDANQLDKAIVSTDSDEIKTVAEDYGGTVPFTRPTELANDTIPAYRCVTHTLDWYRERGETFDIVAMIPVTTPLRTASDIDSAIEQLKQSDAESVIGVSEYLAPPQWAVETGKDGYLHEYYDNGYLWPDDTPRSQDLNDFIHPNGAIYVTKVSTWDEYKKFYTDKTVGYRMPPDRSIDIDEPRDLEIVRALFEAKRNDN